MKQRHLTIGSWSYCVGGRLNHWRQDTHLKWQMISFLYFYSSFHCFSLLSFSFFPNLLTPSNSFPFPLPCLPLTPSSSVINICPSLCLSVSFPFPTCLSFLFLIFHFSSLSLLPFFPHFLSSFFIYCTLNTLSFWLLPITLLLDFLLSDCNLINMFKPVPNCFYVQLQFFFFVVKTMQKCNISSPCLVHGRWKILGTPSV